MPRPLKCRRVCCMPEYREFMPAGCEKNTEPVILTVDEYEAIRLIDQKGLSQEECGAYMNIARTTVQQIYTVARRKLAEVLVEGLPLRIEGGRYKLCEELNGPCSCGNCCRRKCLARSEEKVEEEPG